MKGLFLTGSNINFGIVKSKFYKTENITKRYQKLINETGEGFLIALWFSKALVPVITAEKGVYRLQGINISGEFIENPGVICEKLGLKKHGDVTKSTKIKED